MDYWTIALYGTNSYVPVDTSSEVSLASLAGTTDPMTDTDWLKIKVTGMNRKFIKVDGIKQTVGLMAKNPTGQYTEYSPILVPLVFPTEMKQLEDLMTLLNKDWIYLYQGDYDFSANSWTVHTTGKAVCVATEGTNEDDYDNGVKTLTLKLRKIKPNPRT